MTTPLALTADKYALYQRSVQSPEVDLEIVRGLVAPRLGRAPADLREDFSGTALFAAGWVAGGPERRAWAVDLDPEPLAWGEAHNRAALAPEARERLQLVQADVTTVGPPRVPQVDVIAALNYSFNCFKTRDRLKAYFARARAGLRERGGLVLEVVGGPDVLTEGAEPTNHDGFTYIWERQRFDPIRQEMRCQISFAFPDGSFIEPAFSYDWRLWSIRELRELLAEAGFASSQTFWEGTGPDGQGDRKFVARESARSEPAWTAYVVGWR
jgi:SAM-dependent methyltransferase